jgi:hypothetical protein
MFGPTNGVTRYSREKERRHKGCHESDQIVATFSGISSMQALLEAGRRIPKPMPVIMIRIRRLSVAPRWMPRILNSRNPWSPRRIVERETRITPSTMGRRYPRRLSRKLVSVAVEIVPMGQKKAPAEGLYLTSLPPQTYDAKSQSNENFDVRIFCDAQKQ